MSSFMSTPTTPTLLPTVAMQLSQLSLEYTQHAKPGVVVWLSHPSLEFAQHAHPPVCQLWLRGYLTYPWRMPTTPALLPAVATWLLTNHWSTHTTHSQVWLCGFLTHPWSTPTTPTSLPLPAVATWLTHQSLEYAHHAQPGVAMWLSHPSLEYAHHAHLSASTSCGYVAISPIPGVHTPRPARCGYLTHPWSMPTMPTSLPLPAVATWLSHLSLDHAHHAHPSTSCGYVASHQSLEYAHHARSGAPISPIPGVHPPRPPICLCQLWLRGYLTYPWITPTTPTLLPAVATWLLINPWSTHTTPNQVCLSHISLEYAHHTHPLPAVAISLIPGSCPPRPPFYQLWLCGFTNNTWSTPNAPSHLPGVAMWLCPVSLEHAHHAHPLSAAATQLSQLSLKYTHPTASCDYKTSHLSLDYAHHAQPAAGVVAMWPSHFSPAGIQRLASMPPEYALPSAAVAVHPSLVLS